MSDSARPASFADFVGQDKPKRVLEILCRSAKKRREPVCHVLLSGPPGLGKTTLARIVAHEMGSHLIELVASNVQTPDDLVRHLLGVKTGDVLFIDEIHGLGRSIEEVLYGAMEDRRISVAQAGYDRLLKQLGVSAEKSTVQVRSLPPFTVLGATTLSGLVSDPLRSRFAQILTLEPYTLNELVTICLNAGGKMGLPLTEDVATEIARRSRETARIACGHVGFLREYCSALDKAPDVATALEMFALRDVDEHGLTKTDLLYLSTLVEADAPLAVSTLAASVGESEGTLLNAIEPFLLRQSFVRKTPRGRVALPKAHEAVGHAA